MKQTLARILFVSHASDLRSGGGAHNSLLKLIKYIRLQHEVAVVVPSDGNIPDAFAQIGVRSHRTGPNGVTRQYIPWLCRLIVRERVDLVYGNNYSSGARNALIAAKLTRRPFVWHIREMLRKAHWRYAYFLRYADVLVAISQACAKLVKRQVPRNSVHVVYNGIDLDEFHLDRSEARHQVREILGIPQDHLVVANVGYVCARKGQMRALRIAADIRRNEPTAFFAFLGGLDIEPEYVRLLEEQAAYLNMEDRIRLLGLRNDVPLFLKGADVLLHTAVLEPLGRVILEAMGAELPVVAYAVDGVRELIIDGETGYLVPDGDVNAGAQALAKLLSRPSLRARMGEKARKRVKDKFRADETARQINALIGDVLRKPRPRGARGTAYD